MVIAALLLAAAEPQSALEAERAFAARAQAIGQWAAFREFAAPDAVMFVPQPVKAQEWLAQQQEPRAAVQWWAAESYQSCDGRMAVNTGPWAIPSAKLVGYFTTVWRQGAAGWRWDYDGGTALKAPIAAGDVPRRVRAACRSRPAAPPFLPSPTGQSGKGTSADGTLAYQWHVRDAKGTRDFRAWLWNGRAWRLVLDQTIAE